jgi:hypothetical protein
MKWMDNPLLEGDSEDLLVRGQLQLAMYAVHLNAGHSIYCKQIKAATIEQYVFAAATFLSHFTGIDYRKDLPSHSHMGHILGPVYKDIRRYESFPNRREPYSIAMHTFARTVASKFPSRTLFPALVNLFEQGLCAGYRLSECAQSSGNYTIGTQQTSTLPDGDLATRAIVPSDIRIQTRGLGRTQGLAIVDHPVSSITHIWVKWRLQKNGSHGEEKLFVPNSNTSGVCMVSSLYQSLLRFRQLQAIDGRLLEDEIPLSVYFHPTTATVRLITSRDMESFMRKLAAEVYQLHPVKDATDLQRWGTHSLRVGACVVLHAMGFSPLDIQFILRWKSMAFVAYLRNIAMLSDRQNRAFNRAQAMPHLLC